MKKKKGIYVLLPIVLAIWAVVFYNIFSYTNTEESPVAAPLITQSIQKEDLQKDTFSIKANYHDPFLGKRFKSSLTKRSVSTKDKNEPKSTKKRKPTHKKQNLRWPNINYGGIIKNKKTGKEVALIKINNQKILMAKGDKVGGIALKKITRDSVLLSYENNEKYYLK